MIHTEPITPRLDIPPDALVLEIGSGHAPHRRSDVLVDKFIDDNTERSGALIADRPFIQADAQQLPFKPNSFDYIICRHVVEHLEQPELFFTDAMRIASAGYIETPSVIWELLHPHRSYHRWVLLDVNDEILMLERPEKFNQLPSGYLFPMFNKNSAAYRMLLRQHANVMYVRHVWHNSIRYSINPADELRRQWFEQPWDKAMVGQFVPTRSRAQQTLQLFNGVWHSLVTSLVRRVYKPRHKSRHPQLDVASLMQCPVCNHQSITIAAKRACCPQCDWQTTVFL